MGRGAASSTPKTCRTNGKEPPDARHVSDQRPKARKSRDVYAHFDNDVRVKAPFDAMALAEKLSR